MRQLLLRLDPEGGSRENFGVEFIEHWDQITFGTSMDLINSNPTDSVFTDASTDIQGELFGWRFLRLIIILT